MRVLQVTTHFNIGGITRYILSLSKALKDRGVTTIVATAGGNMEKELSSLGIKHKRISIDTKFEFGPKALRAAFLINDLVKRENIDLMHAHSRVSQVACRLASSMSGVPFVTTCHGYFKKRSRGIFDTWGVKVIAISDAVKNHLVDSLGVKADRIEMIFNGVDTDKFMKKPLPEDIAGLKRNLKLKDGPVIGTIGRLSPVKGQAYLIRAMKRILLKAPQACALIVGSGEEEVSLRNLARSMGLDDHVRFAPSAADTRNLLAVMDVFVFPSVKEGLGLALLEAMASGLPCAASDVGGIKDIIGNNEFGLLFPVGDVESIAASVIKLIENPSLREELGKKGKDAVMKRYTLGQMADKILKLYEGIAR